MKLMENFKVAYDSTIRDANGSIVQFQYGDDGYDATHVVRLAVPAITTPYNRHEFQHDDDMAIIREIDSVDRSSKYFEQWRSEHGETLVACPMDVEAIFERAKILSEGGSLQLPFHIIWNRCFKLISMIENELFQNYLILFLQVRRMRELTEVFFSWFMETIQEKYEHSAVNPGEMVGVLAGQSVAEPATQQVTPFQKYA